MVLVHVLATCGHEKFSVVLVHVLATCGHEKFSVVLATCTSYMWA